MRSGGALGCSKQSQQPKDAAGEAPILHWRSRKPVEADLACYLLDIRYLLLLPCLTVAIGRWFRKLRGEVSAASGEPVQDKSDRPFGL